MKTKTKLSNLENEWVLTVKMEVAQLIKGQDFEQEEVFGNGEAQPEVARSQTHTPGGMECGLWLQYRSGNSWKKVTLLKFGALQTSCSNVRSSVTKE